MRMSHCMIYTAHLHKIIFFFRMPVSATVIAVTIGGRYLRISQITIYLKQQHYFQTPILLSIQIT